MAQAKTPPATSLNQSAANDIFGAGPPPAAGAVQPLGPPLKTVPDLDSPYIPAPSQAAIYQDTGNITNPNRPPTYAQYYTGDEWKPASFGPGRVAEIQAQLVQAGLLNPNDYHRGTWDPQTAAAYKEVLQSANASGMNADSQLELMRSSFTGTAGPKRDPLVTRLTNPDDIRSTANGVAVRLIGRHLTNEEMDPFIASFHELQRGYQKRAYDLGGVDEETGQPGSASGGGGEAVQSPSVQSLAQSRIAAEHPDEVFVQGAKDRFGSFMDLLTKAGA